MAGIATRADIEEWIEAYERAWRTPGVEALADLFSPDATYRMSPYQEPTRGLDGIGELWDAEREGPDEAFEMTSEVIAVEAEVGVARVEVFYGRGTEYRDLWVIRLDAAGRCCEFEEWPFWPDQRIPSLEEPG